jgi:hypothetical protein
MTAVAVLDRFARLGATLAIDGDRVKWRSPVLPPPDLLADLRAFKPAIVDLLSGRATDALADRLTVAARRLRAGPRPEGWTPGDWSAALDALDRFLALNPLLSTPPAIVTAITDGTITLSRADGRWSLTWRPGRSEARVIADIGDSMISTIRSGGLT